MVMVLLDNSKQIEDLGAQLIASLFGKYNFIPLCTSLFNFLNLCITTVRAGTIILGPCWKVLKSASLVGVIDHCDGANSNTMTFGTTMICPKDARTRLRYRGEVGQKGESIARLPPSTL